MSECAICNFNLKPQIEKMIDGGANNEHIQIWAKERVVLPKMEAFM